MEKTRFYSWKKGNLAKGCRYCVEGKKLVLFVTGICSKNCWYCPLSDVKKNKDIVFANEWKTDNVKNIIKEAELCSSVGAGITGGDPFLRLERTVGYIKALKARFGKKFHIHLYAPLNNITSGNLKKLYDAGYTGFGYPKEYGGSERPAWERRIILEEQIRYGSPGMVLSR